jgi:Ca2+-binding RTX toxin-like protein
VDGGADTDTLEIAGDFNDNGDGAIKNFEAINITAAGKNVILEEQTEALVVNGFASGANTIVGGDGKDKITGATGHNDELSGGSGEDTFVGADNNDTIEGGVGDDLLQLVDNYAAAGVNTLVSIENVSLTNNAKKTLDLSNQAVEVFQVTLTGSSGHVVILAGGSDSVDGSAGADSITASSGNDTIKGGAGNDTILGGDELDNLDGGADDDLLDGGKAADTLIGGAGADTLKGQSGEDDLRGGGGIDQLYGGLGSDKFIFDQTDGTTDVIHSYTNSDQFIFDIGDLSLNGGDYSVATSGTLITATAANSLGTNAANNHVIWDTASAISGFKDDGGAFSGAVVAIDKTNGKVMYDADGDFSAGSIVLADFDYVAIVGDNIGFIA